MSPRLGAKGRPGGDTLAALSRMENRKPGVATEFMPPDRQGDSGREKGRSPTSGTQEGIRFRKFLGFPTIRTWVRTFSAVR